jgi:hypothetical protein
MEASMKPKKELISRFWMIAPFFNCLIECRRCNTAYDFDLLITNFFRRIPLIRAFGVDEFTFFYVLVVMTLLGPCTPIHSLSRIFEILLVIALFRILIIPFLSLVLFLVRVIARTLCSIDRILKRIFHSLAPGTRRGSRADQLERAITSGDIATQTHRRSIRVLKLLGAFAWFCSKQNREIIEAIIADLKKDAADMRREKRREFFVQCVLLWRVLGTVLPIAWDGLYRFLAAISRVGKIIRKFKGY